VPNGARRFPRIHAYKGNFRCVAVAAARGPLCALHTIYMVQTHITVPSSFERLKVRGKTLNLIGKRFVTFQVIGKGSKPRYWKLKCRNCGQVFEAIGSRINAGKIKCKCQQGVKHGFARRGNHSPEYRHWQYMKSRCKHDKDYAGLVKYDPRWESFQNFYDDMRPRPEGYSLDRINPFKGYCKRNCRWAPPDVQAGNKRGTLRIGYREVDPSTCTGYRAAVGTIAEWAWYLREATHNPNWTTKKLREVLEVQTLSDIMSAAFPFGITPEGLLLMTGGEFRNMWEGCLDSLYLRRAA